MSREGALLVIIAVSLVLLGLLAIGWWRRGRRDRALQPPVGEAPEGAAVRAVFPALYVATTRHDDPLERLAVRGLGMRSRADITVTDSGVAIDLTGQPRIFIDAGRIADVAQSTVVIDRVVERDGLVRLSWRIDDGVVVDSYFRPQDASARALAATIADIATSSGTDA